MWYKNDGDFIIKDENLVYAWKWRSDNEATFHSWADGLPCDYNLHYNLYDLNKHIILIIIQKNNSEQKNGLFMEEDDWLIYDPSANRNGAFPFYIEIEEDFHKFYLLHNEGE